MAAARLKEAAEKAGRQARAAKVGDAANVRLLSHAAKAKRPLPLKAVATSTMMKVANRILIAKMQIVKL
jgi:hypothetical protein